MLKKVQLRAPEGAEYSILFAGDFCPREENGPYVAENAEKIVSGIKSVFDDADLRILQWETTLTTGGTPIIKDGPNLRAVPECLNFAKALNIDINLLANNHTGDYGPEVVLETIEHHEKYGIRTVGAGKDLAAANVPLVMESPVGKIGLLNIAENEYGIADEFTPGVAPLSPLKNIKQIRELRKQVQILIVAVHGGHEFNPFPSPRMMETYRAFAEAGADIVFNCHTHCIEPVEVYENVPIVYSPGNFYFPASPGSALSWNYGYLIKFYCDIKGCFGYELIPYHFEKEGIFLLDPEENVALKKHYEDLCELIKDPAMVQKLFNAWCVGKAGPLYLNVINHVHEEKFPLDWHDREFFFRWRTVKNIFSCEAHNDMLENLLLLFYQDRTDQALEYLPLLEKYCQMEYINR